MFRGVGYVYKRCGSAAVLQAGQCAAQPFRTRISSCRIFSTPITTRRFRRTCRTPGTCCHRKGAPRARLPRAVVFELAGKQLEELPSAKQAFWRDLHAWMVGGRFGEVVLNKFGQLMNQRFGQTEVSLYPRRRCSFRTSRTTRSARTTRDAQSHHAAFLPAGRHVPGAPRHIHLRAEAVDVSLRRRPALPARGLRARLDDAFPAELALRIFQNRQLVPRGGASGRPRVQALVAALRHLRRGTGRGGRALRDANRDLKSSFRASAFRVPYVSGALRPSSIRPEPCSA